MPHILSFLILLCFLIPNAFVQEQPHMVIEDFNTDGHPDTLISCYEGGSGFGGKYVMVINGKTNECFELTTYGSFGDFTRYIWLTPSLEKPENLAFLKALKAHLLPPKQSTPDGSLLWILQSRVSHTTPKKNKYFDLIIDPKTEWMKSLSLPSTYYLEISSDSMYHASTYFKDDTQNKAPGQGKGFLIYYAHNHYRHSSGDSLICAESNSTYKVCYTAHGVLVKKGAQFKWVFISDKNITGAPGKLRCSSIGKIELFDKYLLIQQNIPPKEQPNWFILNIETGRLARLKSQSFQKPAKNLLDALDTFAMPLIK